MTLLKAISTLPKRVKSLFVFIIITLCLSPLGAESFSLIVDGTSSSYTELVKTVLSSFSTVGSERIIALREERAERETAINNAIKLTNENRNESWSGKKEEEKEVDYTLLDLKIQEADLSLYKDYLSSGDRDANEWVKIRYSADAVLYAASDGGEDIERIDLYFDGEMIHSAWYNTLTAGSEEDILYSLFSSLLLSEDYSLYRVNRTPEDSTLLLDGVNYESGSGYVILKDGIHTFTLSSYGYEESIFTYNLDGSSSDINLTLEKDEGSGIHLITYPFDADIYFNGIKTEKKTLEGVFTPYIISLSSPSFASYSYQERRKQSSLTLSMAPLWTESVDIMTKEKGDFYSSLFYLLLSFGGYTASTAISNYYSQTLGSISKVVFTGCSVVSLINLVQSAVDYFNSAKTGL